jgi:hypothetical protein
MNFLSAELERAKSEQIGIYTAFLIYYISNTSVTPIGTEQMLQQVQKEMAQKERDIQDMMTLADEAFQQKNGSSEKMWMAKIQKLHEDFREKDAAHQRDLSAQEDTIARLRLELAQSQVVNRRLSSHFSFPTEDVVEEPEDFPEPSTRRASGGFALRGKPHLFLCSFLTFSPTDSIHEQQIRELQSKIDSYMEEIAQLKEERDTLADEIKFLRCVLLAKTPINTYTSYRDREQEQKQVIHQAEITLQPTPATTSVNVEEILLLKARVEELLTENKEYNSMV